MQKWYQLTCTFIQANGASRSLTILVGMTSVAERRIGSLVIISTMNCSFMKIPWISREKPVKNISWPMNTAKWNFMGLFLALNFPWIRGIFFMTHEFLQSLFLWPIDLPWKSPELISWPMNFFISLLSWPMNFFKVYFHDPLVSPESHQNEFHAHELQSNSISWANNLFVLGEQN